MKMYLVRRTLAIIPTMLLVILFVVMLVRLIPGDAVDVMMAQATASGGFGLDRDDRAIFAERMGLDRSVPEAYAVYTMDALRGDLGTSFFSSEGVSAMIARTLPTTMVLGAFSMAWGVAFGLFVGMFSATHRGSMMDLGLRSMAVVGLSVPNFVLATSLVVLPTLWWRWSPPVFYTSFSATDPWPYFAQFIAPALVLGFSLSAIVMRLSRTMLLEVMGQDYIRTARSKGLPGSAIMRRHALKNAMIPIISVVGLQVAFIVSGSVIVESIFGLPGMGRALITAVGQRDYPVIQGITLVAGFTVVLANLAVDFSYGILDPRVRY